MLTQIYDNVGSWSSFYIGLKADDWTNSLPNPWYSVPDGFEFDLNLRLNRYGPSPQVLRMSIEYNTNNYNGYIDIPYAQLINASAFIELIDNGNRINMGVSDSSLDDPETTTFANWSNAIKYTTFISTRNFVSKDVVIYWGESNTNFTPLDWSNISIGPSNEVDTP